MIRTKLFSLTAGVFLALSAAATAEIAFKGGDGASVETAIVVLGAQGSSDGVAAEYQWIEANRPGAEVLGQALVQNGDRFYDVITIRVGGREEDLFFDITDFFGKF
ncbi:hypothetical protein [Tabrizicola sp.]|uniref:hypothetical protein n=1 Tax=Tabrizicola sp. TaxID=2005166 RepID=UPI003F391806